MAARDSETLLPRNLRYRETFWVVADILRTVVPRAVTIDSVAVIWLISSFQALATSGRSFPRLGLADRYNFNPTATSSLSSSCSVVNLACRLR